MRTSGPKGPKTPVGGRIFLTCKGVYFKGAYRLGSVLGRTDFSRISIFGPPDFFADFLAGFFLLIFVGKSAQKNPPAKSPAKSSKIYTTKIPDTFLQRGRANIAQSRLFYREMGCPVQCSLAMPSALESQFRAIQGSVVANPICKWRCQTAGHLQVRVAVGRRPTCVFVKKAL